MSESYEAALEVNAALHTVEQSIDTVADELADIRKILFAWLVNECGGIKQAEQRMAQGVIMRDHLAAARPLMEGGGE